MVAALGKTAGHGKRERPRLDAARMGPRSGLLGSVVNVRHAIRAHSNLVANIVCGSKWDAPGQGLTKRA